MTYRPIGINDSHRITWETDCGFLFLIQRAILLALKDEGHLTEIQHRQAEEILLQEYRKKRCVSVNDD